MKEVTSVFDLKIGDRVEYGGMTPLVIGNAYDSEKNYGALLMVEGNNGASTYLITTPIDGIFKVISEGNIEYGNMAESNVVLDFETLFPQMNINENLEQVLAKDLNTGDDIYFSGQRLTVQSVDHRAGFSINVNLSPNRYSVSNHNLYPKQTVAEFVTRKQPSGITADFRTKD